MRVAKLPLLLALAAGLAAAQAPASNPTVASGTKVDAQLKSKLDSQHAQVGDKVTAVTTAAVKENGQTVLPKGATLTGHITQVTKAESKKSPSHIGVLFDQATTKKGQVIPLRAAISSVFVARSNPDMDSSMAMPMPGPPMGGMPGGGAMGGGGGLGSGIGSVASGAVAAAGGAAGDIDAHANGNTRQTLGDQPLPQVMTQADGQVTAMARASNGSPLSIAVPAPSAAAAANASAGGVISTPRGDVKIDSGTRVQLVVLGGGH